MPLSEPKEIWAAENNLDVYSAREDKGQFMMHLNAGDGPFKVVQVYYYGQAAGMPPGFPDDGYFKIETPILDATGKPKTGWVTGISNNHYKVSFTAPKPVEPPAHETLKFLVTVDVVTKQATITTA